MACRSCFPLIVTVSVAATLSLLAGTVACFLPLLTYNRNVRLAKERQDALKRY